jgi:hypothetical protein
MGREMNETQLAVEAGDLGHQILERDFVNVPVRKPLIQSGLGLNDLLANSDGTVRHRASDFLYLRPLLPRQAQVGRQLEHVFGPGVVIQFSRFRQSHPFAATQSLQLLLGEGRDLARLFAGVGGFGVVVLGPKRSGLEARKQKYRRQ